MPQIINKEEIRNILITRTDRLGDVLLTLPLVSETKRIFKGAKIYFLVKKYLEDLLKGYQGIDKLIIEEDIPYCMNKYEYLDDKNIDLVINVKPGFDQAFLFYALGIKYRIGTAYRWYSFLYNCKVYEHRKISDKHESDYNLNLLRTFFKETGNDKKYYFNYSTDERIELDKKLKLYDFSLDENFIIIHPGSGGSAKDLPAETFIKILKFLMENFSEYKIVITGLDDEKILISSIINGVSQCRKIIDLTGKLNLKELMILTDESKLFISNSTGPIHIAGALNKNIIGFYPNEPVMSEKRWGPLSANKIIIKPDSDSGEMSSIKSEEIFIAIKKFLN